LFESAHGGIQTVGSLERQHPPWILRVKSADLIQLPELVLGECEFDRREIVLKLVEAFRANDDRGYRSLLIPASIAKISEAERSSLAGDGPGLGCPRSPNQRTTE